MKNYEFWRKDLELIFMDKNVPLEKGKSDSFSQSIRSTSDEVHLKKLLDKNLEIITEYFSKDLVNQLQDMENEKNKMKAKYEGEVKSYKDKLNSQVKQIQAQVDGSIK
jgi:hypothetical protein